MIYWRLQPVGLSCTATGLRFRTWKKVKCVLASCVAASGSLLRLYVGISFLHQFILPSSAAHFPLFDQWGRVLIRMAIQH
eukprot:1934662-Pleurochrysis_carterae.AAC.4